MFTLSLSDTRQQGFTTYLRQLKNCYSKSICPKGQNLSTPQPICHSCQKLYFKTNGVSHQLKFDTSFLHLISLGFLWQKHYVFGELASKGQFHQHFTCKFFCTKVLCVAFFSYVSALQFLAPKYCVLKMLMKSTPYDRTKRLLASSPLCFQTSTALSI